jgi:hypothetical protein
VPLYIMIHVALFVRLVPAVLSRRVTAFSSQHT